MLDAALELGALGHRTALFTSAMNPARTFDDATNGCVDVRVRVSRLPAAIARRVRVPCAVVRMAGLAAAARRELAPDLVLCDLVPQAIAAVRRLARAPVLFYCHYPDALLAPPGGVAYRLYRWGLDALERQGMGCADGLATNSQFTRRAMGLQMPRLAADAVPVVYPGVDLMRFGQLPPVPEAWSDGDEVVVASVGRFHPDKDHPLAVSAFAALLRQVPDTLRRRLRLVISGGLDATRPEEQQVRAALAERIRAYGLGAQVALLVSPTDAAQRELMARASLVLHTAPAEHFGMSPVEAMAAGRPVVAVARGGLLETIRDGETGFLREPTAEALAGALATACAEPAMVVRMGRQARVDAQVRFSRQRFGQQLHESALAAFDRGATGHRPYGV